MPIPPNSEFPTGPMAGPALAGLTLLSSQQTITFGRYVRYVLPLDGYVYWLRTANVDIAGSLHVRNTRRQSEDELISVNQVVFTTTQEIEQFNDIGPDHIWVGTTPELKFAFLSSGPTYTQSGLFHYAGDTVYPALESQLVDYGSQLSKDTLVVSNSLPAWLSLYSYNPIWVSTQVPNPFVQLFPSFLPPLNLQPPYGVVHIYPEGTQAQQSAPRFYRVHTSQETLASDDVKVTFYGLTNEQAMDFVALLFQYSMDTDILGMQSMPVVVDEKRQQTELGILAMKKSIRMRVSYNQGAIRTVARTLIEQASATITPSPFALEAI
jgi:hypothetical protein